MTISFGGLGNGIDFGPVVDALVKAQRIPIDNLTQQKLQASQKQTDLALLGGKLLSLQGLASSLRTQASFNKNQVNVASGSAQPPLSAYPDRGPQPPGHSVQFPAGAADGKATQ